MHKGRYAPRVKPQWLSADCEVPWFAPTHLSFNTTFIHDGIGYDLGWSDWTEAEVDEVEKTIVYSGETMTDDGLFMWLFVQSRSGEPTELKIAVVIEDWLGFELRKEYVPAPALWAYTVTPNFLPLGGWTTSGHFSTFNVAAGVQAKPWR